MVGTDITCLEGENWENIGVRKVSVLLLGSWIS